MPAHRPLVMGVVNVTPDSFSDGGRWFEADAAVRHALDLFDEGADVVDIGGESTRPGAQEVPEAEELRRVIPVVEAVVAEGRGRVSVDTRKRRVAERALEAGATLLNDVSASLHEVAAAAGAGVGYVAMHMQGSPATMQQAPHYDDVVAEVRDHLVERAAAARLAGVGEVWIDPGIGFGKTAQHNLTILARLGALVDTGYSVVVGTSRKRFLQRLLDSPADDVLEGTLATCVAAMAAGASMVRVHDVRAVAQASRVVAEQVA